MNGFVPSSRRTATFVPIDWLLPHCSHGRGECRHLNNAELTRAPCLAVATLGSRFSRPGRHGFNGGVNVGLVLPEVPSEHLDQNFRPRIAGCGIVPDPARDQQDVRESACPHAYGHLEA